MLFQSQPSRWRVPAKTRWTALQAHAGTLAPGEFGESRVHKTQHRLPQERLQKEAPVASAICSRQTLFLGEPLDMRYQLVLRYRSCAYAIVFDGGRLAAAFLECDSRVC